jgi:hypothetical protein
MTHTTSYNNAVTNTYGTFGSASKEARSNQGIWPMEARGAGGGKRGQNLPIENQ